MAIKDYTYSALAPGTVFANGDSAKATAIGATNTSVTNGTLAISPDGKGLVGTDQSVSSGTSYVYETIAGAPMEMSVSVFWELPALGSVGASPFFVGSGGGSTRVMAFSILSTEQIRFFNAAGTSIFTSTVSGGFTPGKYRTDFYFGVGSSQPLRSETYLEESTTPITGASVNLTGQNFGTGAITSVRHGTRAGTGTADNNFQISLRYDFAGQYLIGPRASGFEDSVTDAVGVSDSISLNINRSVSLADGVGITDTETDQQLGFGVTLSDSLGATDTAARTSSRAPVQPDPVGVSDSLTSAMTRAQPIADAVGVEDGLNVDLVRNTPINISDGVSVSDDVNLSLTSSGSFTAGDGLPVSDNVTVSQTKNLLVSDGVGVTDAASTAFQEVVTTGDAAGVTDSVAATMSRQSSVSDEVGTFDEIVVDFFVALDPGVDDGAGITDELIVEMTRAYMVELADSVIAVDDDLLTGLGYDIALSDDVSLADLAETDGILVIPPVPANRSIRNVTPARSIRLVARG